MSSTWLAIAKIMTDILKTWLRQTNCRTILRGRSPIICTKNLTSLSHALRLSKEPNSTAEGHLHDLASDSGL